MPATNEKFTLNIEPLGDHLQVTIPELGITVQTTGTTRREAEQVALRCAGYLGHPFRKISS